MGARTGRQHARYGVCALTGKQGKFVKCHIIPAALTRISESGAAFFQYGEGLRPTKRFTSWYDQGLVVRSGEDIFEALDTWAIATLRKSRLVWSGWGDDRELGQSHDAIDDSFGVRSVSLDTKKLRLFFLSLLWRAGRTSLAEFKQIELSNEECDIIRSALLGGAEPPADFFPVQLTQLSTIGPIHNHAPLRELKRFPDGDGGERDVEIYRFYFDGLIAHFTLPASVGNSLVGLGGLVVGGADAVVIPTVTFEDSLQRKGMTAILREYGLDEEFSRAR